MLDAFSLKEFLTDESVKLKNVGDDSGRQRVGAAGHEEQPRELTRAKLM